MQELEEVFNVDKYRKKADYSRLRQSARPSTNKELIRAINYIESIVMSDVNAIAYYNSSELQCELEALKDECIIDLFDCINNSEKEVLRDELPKFADERLFILKQNEELERLRSEVAGLREAVSSSVCESSEAVEALHRRVQELEDEKQRLEQELSRLTDEVEELRDQKPRHGRPTNSGLNRHERTALLVELLASVTGLDAQELTGANAKLQGQGLKALACVSGLITDIAKGQRSKVLSEYREYQKKGQHKRIKEHRLQPERTNVVALIKEIAAMQQRLQTTD